MNKNMRTYLYSLHIVICVRIVYNSYKVRETKKQITRRGWNRLEYPRQRPAATEDRRGENPTYRRRVSRSIKATAGLHQVKQGGREASMIKMTYKIKLPFIGWIQVSEKLFNLIAK